MALALVPAPGLAQDVKPWSAAAAVRVVGEPAAARAMRACLEDELLKLPGISLSEEAETEISVRLQDGAPPLASVVVGSRMPPPLIDHLIEKRVDPGVGKLLSLFQLVEGQLAATARDLPALCRRIAQAVDAEIFDVQRRAQTGGTGAGR